VTSRLPASAVGLRRRVRPERVPALGTVARWEMRAAARSRWLVASAAVYAVAAVTVTLVGLRSLRELGLGGVGAVVDGIVALGVLLPPLVGLLLGASSIAGAREQGTLALVCAQPIDRGAIAWGSMIGLTLTIWTAVLAGLGLVAVVVAPVATLTDLGALLVAVAATLVAAAVGTALGVLVSAVSTGRSQAAALAAGIWFVTALGFDLLLAAVVPAVRLGPSALLGAVVLNPLESLRVLAFLLLDVTALGPFGAHLVARFGHAGAIALLGAVVAAWVVVPLLVAARVLRRRDA
jgi:Cu-processing system permease protein